MRFKDTSYYVALGKAQEQLRTMLTTNKLETENVRLRAELEQIKGENMPFANMFTNTGPITRDEDKGPLREPTPDNNLPNRARQDSPKVLYTTTETIAKMCETYESEITRLKAELEARKLKPVVIIREVEIKANPEGGTYFGWSPSNVRFTFHDGKLVKAEVIGGEV